MNINIDLPKNVQLILDKLEEYGSIGYVVGGCVRDSILGKIPHDWDICTPLLPDAIEAVLKEYPVIETGIKHGTVTVCIDNEQYEITTYRIDGEYSDGRRPDNVNFTDRLEEDLKRRDFTINAMAYNPKIGLVDNYKGLIDLKYGTIRCVGNPYDRFSEDALRILRALRFSAVLGFEIEHKTARVLEEKRSSLTKPGISPERIMTEIVKMLSESNPHSLAKVIERHDVVFWTIFPSLLTANCDEYDDNEIIDTFMYRMPNIIKNTPNDLYVRLAALFCDIEDDLQESAREAEIILHGMKFDNKTVKSVGQLIERHEMYHELSGDYDKDGYVMRKLLHDIGIKQIFRLVELWKANVKAKTNIGKYDRLRNIDFALYIAQKTIETNECYTLKQLDISGDDLIELGFEPGIKIGEVLNKLLDEVMREPFKNKRNWLISWAEKELNNETDE